MRIFSIIIAGYNSIDQQTHIYSKVYDIFSENQALNGYSARNFFKKFCKNTSPQLLTSGSDFKMSLGDNIVVYVVSSSKAPVAAYAFCDETYSKKATFLLLKQALAVFELNHLNTYSKYLEDKNLECGLSELLSYYQFPYDFDQYGLYMMNMTKNLIENSYKEDINMDILQNVIDEESNRFDNRLVF